MKKFYPGESNFVSQLLFNTLGYVTKGFVLEAIDKSKTGKYDCNNSENSNVVELRLYEYIGERAVDLAVALEAVSTRWCLLYYPTPFDKALSEPFGRYLFNQSSIKNWESTSEYIAKEFVKFFLETKCEISGSLINTEITAEELQEVVLQAVKKYRTA